jgi:hypothetical protein
MTLKAPAPHHHTRLIERRYGFWRGLQDGMASDVGHARCPHPELDSRPALFSSA